MPSVATSTQVTGMVRSGVQPSSLTSPPGPDRTWMQSMGRHFLQPNPNDEWSYFSHPDLGKTTERLDLSRSRGGRDLEVAAPG